MKEEERPRLEFEGEVTSAVKDRFKVKVNDKMTVDCTLSGKIRKNNVRILLGDRVTIEISEYDTSKGRIIFRHKR